MCLKWPFSQIWRLSFIFLTSQDVYVTNVHWPVCIGSSPAQQTVNTYYSMVSTIATPLSASFLFHCEWSTRLEPLHRLDIHFNASRHHPNLRDINRHVLMCVNFNNISLAASISTCTRFSRHIRWLFPKVQTRCVTIVFTNDNVSYGTAVVHLFMFKLWITKLTKKMPDIRISGIVVAFSRIRGLIDSEYTSHFTRLKSAILK